MKKKCIPSFIRTIDLYFHKYNKKNTLVKKTIIFFSFLLSNIFSHLKFAANHAPSHKLIQSQLYGELDFPHLHFL